MSKIRGGKRTGHWDRSSQCERPSQQDTGVRADLTKSKTHRPLSKGVYAHLGARPGKRAVSVHCRLPLRWEGQDNGVTTTPCPREGVSRNGAVKARYTPPSSHTTSKRVCIDCGEKNNPPTWVPKALRGARKKASFSRVRSFRRRRVVARGLGVMRR